MWGHFRENVSHVDKTTNRSETHMNVWNLEQTTLSEGSFSSRRNFYLHRRSLQSEFKNPKKAVLNFFSSNAVDDGVDCRWEQNVHEPHEGVGVRRYVDVHVVREEGDGTHQVETHHDDQVSAAGVKRLPAVLPGRRRSQYDAQDLHVGEEDERHVHTHKAYDHSEARHSVFIRTAA